MKKAPEVDDERQLDDIVSDAKTEVSLRGSRWRIGWLKNGTKRKVTHIMLSEKEETMVNTKCLAAMLLNGYWKIKFFYPILWRWFYYIKQYTDGEMIPVIEECKKKFRWWAT